MLHVDEDFYRNEIPGLSEADIKEIQRSPAHYRQNKLYPPEPTAEMIFNNAVKMAILEPHRFYEKYTYLDDEAICETIGGGTTRNKSIQRMEG